MNPDILFLSITLGTVGELALGSAFQEFDSKSSDRTLGMVPSAIRPTIKHDSDAKFTPWVPNEGQAGFQKEKETRASENTITGGLGPVRYWARSKVKPCKFSRATHPMSSATNRLRFTGTEHGRVLLLIRKGGGVQVPNLLGNIFEDGISMGCLKKKNARVHNQLFRSLRILFDNDVCEYEMCSAWREAKRETNSQLAIPPDLRAPNGALASSLRIESRIPCLQL